MSLRGLELLHDLTEIINAGQALDNLCNGDAQPFTSDDFKVFRSNKENTSVLSYIPNNFTFNTSAFNPQSYKLGVEAVADIQSEIINLNISIQDKVNGAGIDADSVIEKIDTYFNEDVPITEIILDSVINTEVFTGDISVTKQNNATIDNNFITLGTDLQYSFYNGDKITKIIYPLSSTSTPLLSTEERPLYIVDLFVDNEERINFGLAESINGERINLTSLNSLSVINFYRNNEVTQNDILNLLLPDSRESTKPGYTTFTSSDYPTILDIYKDKDSKFNKSFNDLQQTTDGYLAPIDTKINLAEDIVNDTNITVSGSVKVADPDIVNNSIVSDEIYAPSVYITDPITGNINDKVRIFSSFDSPWITTTDTLSTDKSIVVGDLLFEDGININNIEITTVDSTLLGFNYNRKIPLYVEDSDGVKSTYYLLASSVN